MTERSMFICSNCGYGSGSWLGRCTNCDQWNTFIEQAENKRSKEKTLSLDATPLADISIQNKDRKKTGIDEIDRVLGGGMLPGEVILLSGEPGVGKSTLLLQALRNLETIYISGEESAYQVKERAARLKINLNNILFSTTTQVEGIVDGVESQQKPYDVLVIDSIQTVYTKTVNSPAGTISQLKESLAKLITLAKKTNLIIFVIGHVTKEGEVAGPKALEHMVDCVLTLEGEKISHHRILRPTKNRFGAADEIGIFEMTNSGFKEVSDPLAFLEEDKQNDAPGKAVVGVAEGKRYLFFEIQVLASSSNLPVPRRVVKGVDYNKVLLLLAVIKKQLGIPLDNYDVYVNVVGGVSLRSTSVDLGIIAALLSSIKNVTIPKKTTFIGEVGLLGEVRKVFFEDKLVSEARRLKFSKIFFSKNIKTVRDLRRILF